MARRHPGGSALRAAARAPALVWYVSGEAAAAQRTLAFLARFPHTHRGGRSDLARWDLFLATLPYIYRMDIGLAAGLLSGLIAGLTVGLVAGLAV
ncbi:hypothetical protein OG946_00290 [Streptomyces sp. NBC_01808]|uniref:hypothetical protein n=1 Tax=Streptomyces sp. NBC_01808 TaxID=2975947 RepID=UPI002DD92126|nr:hypothetical protein [Streptomyces sp. NBC_01808]WSA35947.1 hypothetical protein OG946_00290 [Streptomyces sp. NBC_01808]